MKKNHLAILGLLALGALSAPAQVVVAEDPVPNDCATTCQLTAGQTINAGNVTVWNDDTNVYVQYTLDTTAHPDAVFGTLHLWVGPDILDVPANPQGTPVPGQFPYTHDAAGLTTYTFTVPIGTEELPYECGLDLYVVAHAEISLDGEDETGFGGSATCGYVGTGPRWWFYMSHELSCDCGGGDEGGSFATAYAKGGYVWTTSNKSNPEGLPSLELTKNRWGWAIRLGTTGETQYDIWAGAGLNKTSNGTLVGTATVNWDGSSVTVTYDLDDGYTMKAIHVYAGDSAPATIAPGQYGYIESFDPYVSSDESTLSLEDTNEDGYVWVVMHAEVWGSF